MQKNNKNNKIYLKRLLLYTKYFLKFSKSYKSTLSALLAANRAPKTFATNSYSHLPDRDFVMFVIRPPHWLEKVLFSIL